MQPRTTQQHDDWQVMTSLTYLFTRHAQIGSAMFAAMIEQHLREMARRLRLRGDRNLAESFEILAGDWRTIVHVAQARDTH